MLSREELEEGVELTLVRSKDDAEKFSHEFQQELAGVVGALRDAG
ncbi:MAG TPA: hypothetical protein VK578_13935 [Edaphobacter sp.]|nr:hypothetical protein [Edaphobacter sp.]